MMRLWTIFFKTIKLCVFAGCKDNKRKKFPETIMKKEEHDDMLVKIIREEPKNNFGEEESGTSLSHSEKPNVEMDSTSLAFKDDQ